MRNIRGPKTKKFLVDEIILLKKGDNSLSAGKIRDMLLSSHPQSKAVPKERAIYKILERNKDKTIPSDLDKLWSVGNCLKYGISPSVVISIQRELLRYNRFETIRRARWYSMLHPILCPLLEKTYPEQPDCVLWLLHQIASFYTRIEQIAEINGDELDTHFLDDTFIIKQDFSSEAFSRIYHNLYYQMPEKPSKLADQKASVQTAEQILAKEMNKIQAKKLNEFIELDATDLEKAITFQNANPDMQLFIYKWRALNLRRDIRINKKDGAK